VSPDDNNAHMSWSELADWWVIEVVEDPAYETVVTPLLLDILEPVAGRIYLDLGCGEGRVMRTVSATGSVVHGIELNLQLAERAARIGPTIVGSLPDLGFLTDDSYDGAYCVLVLEHIPDHSRLFQEVARVVKPGGRFALVMNHPFWTAPGSTPITDEDGETLWRPGAYFSTGTSEEPAGESRIVFQHRTLADLLNRAAAAGLTLERVDEIPDHEHTEQIGLPRLLACRWRLLP
jgi:SAM-dependent methyltransferase